MCDHTNHSGGFLFFFNKREKEITATLTVQHVNQIKWARFVHAGEIELSSQNDQPNLGNRKRTREDKKADVILNI